MDFLYLIRCNEYHKIGVASDVRNRIASLQTGNPYKLELVSCWEFPNAEIVERALHQKFSSLRQLGEWFCIPNSRLSEFDVVCEVLGGVRKGVSNHISSEEIEDAEEEQEVTGDFSPTIEDVRRLMNDPNYRLEYRYGDYGLRGYAWRRRSGNKECPLYIGRRSPIFDEVSAMIPEHRRELGNE